MFSLSKMYNFFTLKAMSIGFLQEHKFLAVTISLKSLTFHRWPIDSTSLSNSFVKLLSPKNKIVLCGYKIRVLCLLAILLSQV